MKHYVRVTQAAFNIEEMLLGVFIDLTNREIVFVPHALQIIEGGGIDVGRNHLAELLRYTTGGERLGSNAIVLHDDALDICKQ